MFFPLQTSSVFFSSSRLIVPSGPGKKHPNSTQYVPWNLSVQWCWEQREFRILNARDCIFSISRLFPECIGCFPANLSIIFIILVFRVMIKEGLFWTHLHFFEVQYLNVWAKDISELIFLFFLSFQIIHYEQYFFLRQFTSFKTQFQKNHDKIHQMMHILQSKGL